MFRLEHTLVRSLASYICSVDIINLRFTAYTRGQNGTAVVPILNTDMMGMEIFRMLGADTSSRVGVQQLRASQGDAGSLTLRFPILNNLEHNSISNAFQRLRDVEVFVGPGHSIFASP